MHANNTHRVHFHQANNSDVFARNQPSHENEGISFVIISGDRLLVPSDVEKSGARQSHHCQR